MTFERFAARRERLTANLLERSFDGLVVSSLPNIRYLTGFTGSSAALVTSVEGTTLFTDFRYREQCEREVTGAVRVEIVTTNLWDPVLTWVKKQPVQHVIGFEAHILTYEQSRILLGQPQTTLKGCTDVVESLRVAKEPEEIDAIRRAGTVAAEALSAIIPHITVGTREIDVAARLEYELRQRGSEWHPFRTIVASGERSALPHASTSDRILAPGDLVLIDFGAQIDGYCSDLTRTFIVGARADDRQRAVYGLVQAAQKRAIDLAQADMTGEEIDRLARGVIDGKGFGDAFGHSLGHGLGLEIHEAPRLSRVNTHPVKVGSVVTIEPGVYVPGWGGVRIEDDAVMTPQGFELLTNGRTELTELV